MYNNECQTNAFLITREKKLDLAKKQSSRNVYSCHVIGPKSSGKTTLCRTFIDPKLEVYTNKPVHIIIEDKYIELRMQLQKLSDEAVPPNAHITVNTVHVYGQEKTIILRDINIMNVQDALTPAQIQCDVAALVYDASNPKSFEFIARVYIVSVFHTIRVNDSTIQLCTKNDFLVPEIFCR